MENDWLTSIKRLQALSATGLVYSRDQYDRERFEDIHHIACEMLSRVSHAPPERIFSLSPDTESYPTPKVDVRAAVIHDNRILLVGSSQNSEKIVR